MSLIHPAFPCFFTRSPCICAVPPSFSTDRGAGRRAEGSLSLYSLLGTEMGAEPVRPTGSVDGWAESCDSDLTLSIISSDLIHSVLWWLIVFNSG